MAVVNMGTFRIVHQRTGRVFVECDEGPVMAVKDSDGDGRGEWEILRNDMFGDGFISIQNKKTGGFLAVSREVREESRYGRYMHVYSRKDSEIVLEAAGGYWSEGVFSGRLVFGLDGGYLGVFRPRRGAIWNYSAIAQTELSDNCLINLVPA